MEREETEKVIELYNTGYSYQIIGDTLGVSKKQVGRIVSGLKARGLIEDRPLPTGHTRQPRTENHTKHQNNLERVRGLYEANTPLTEICSITGFRYHSVIRIISELHKGGMPKRKKQVKQKEFIPIKRNVSFRIGEPHHCDPDTCVFGAKSGEFKCNFASVTGRCRSLICKSSACTVYEKITKDNPRRKGSDELSCQRLY